MSDQSTPDQQAVEEAALATYRDDPQDSPDAGGSDPTADGPVSPLGGTTSGEEDYVAVDPAGYSGQATAGLVAEDEDGRGESGPEPGAQVTGSGGR
jgi:hypothetical protein